MKSVATGQKEWLKIQKSETIEALKAKIAETPPCDHSKNDNLIADLKTDLKDQGTELSDMKSQIKETVSSVEVNLTQLEVIRIEREDLTPEIEQLQTEYEDVQRKIKVIETGETTDADAAAWERMTIQL